MKQVASLALVIALYFAGLAAACLHGARVAGARAASPAAAALAEAPFAGEPELESEEQDLASSAAATQLDGHGG